MNCQRIIGLLLFACLTLLIGRTTFAQFDKRQSFQVAKHNAFLIEAPQANRVKGATPWVWYAPTFKDRLPSRDEKWMIDRLNAKGIAIAGVDVGESYGSPKGRKVFQALYDELTQNRGFSTKPVLLARSRGGLMLYSWANENPKLVSAVAGIYPVCNIASYPGIAKAAGAYEMTAEELKKRLTEFNPVDRLEKLAAAKVPIFHLQGDSDQIVPHEKNTELLAKRYQKMGGPVKVELIKGQGHNMWRGWFESQRLTDFMIAKALGLPEFAFGESLIDNMSLKALTEVKIWGWSAPNAKVVVEFAGRTESATADSNGKWAVNLNGLKASEEKGTLKATCDKQSIELTGINVIANNSADKK